MLEIIYIQHSLSEVENERSGRMERSYRGEWKESQKGEKGGRGRKDVGETVRIGVPATCFPKRSSTGCHSIP